ncbi:hypothetical protein MYCTH_100838 [Thermothelomyces thermophilus ATCC 42464]|uniref:Fungal lipase-type domain-containing protein n=1 Tax=Thermothelomyces thermophilus (strain ATCC 42464 / BCRC 31852 / DSM 1799) TaxID=573729 RepID=G2Q8I8_THET4|nr:uncharacterized protein MYCTH_100838 [Thermothelomyces thermophilus ATCC 42464]AEO56237.1 hypothetical protein MYCTH_100838 [Thermothelomyces thermophilus ATCC 42464]
MKSLLTFLPLASVALGAPSLWGRQAAITEEQLNELELYVQWAAAAACNGNQAPNQPVICNPTLCSRFASHNATVVASFIGPETDIWGFIGLDPVDERIVVSFRGSSSIQNWITDFDIIQRPCNLTDDCLVHTGFDRAWEEVANEVLNGLTAAAAAHPSYRIAVTGHSLGGAVATVTAAHVRRAGFQADLYTYGSPRVGNEAFADFVTRQPGAEYRVTHADDPVPRLPPLCLNYRHTSPEYWIDPDDKDVVSIDEIRYCPGYSNTDCNGGTAGLDTSAHGWYFQNLSGCAQEISRYAEMDVKLAANLNAQGQP